MRREAGFTLTEMLVTMTVVATLLGIAVPSYKYITTADRVSAEINGLLGDLQFARSEAIKQGQNVTVCPSSDGQTCLTGTTWNTGWLVWADLNGSGTIDPGEVLRFQQGFTSTDTLTSNNSSVPNVVFNREGFSTTLGQPNNLYTLHDATSNPQYTRCLTLQLSGLSTTSTHTSDPTNCT